MGTIGTVGDTTFVDDTVLPGINYTYSLLIENSSGLTVVSVEQATGNLPSPITVQDPLLDPWAATALIRWTPFAGTDFVSYEVIRKTATDAQLLASILDPNTVSFTDIDLEPTVEFTYQVALNRSNGQRFVASASPDGNWLLETSFGSFTSATDVAVNRSNGRVYVLDADDNSVRSYDNIGISIDSFTPSELVGNLTQDILVGPDGSIWISSLGLDNTLLNLTPGGELIEGLKIAPRSSFFHAPGIRFLIAMDSSGEIISLGKHNTSVEIAPGLFQVSTFIFRVNDQWINLGGAEGDRPNLYEDAIGLFGNNTPQIDIFSDQMVISDADINTVHLFNLDSPTSASLVGDFASSGTFDAPTGLAFDTSGRLYVLDKVNPSRIQVFEDSNLILQWNLEETVHDIAIDNQGNVFIVSDTKVYKYAR